MRLIDADAIQNEYMRYHDGRRIVIVDLAPTIEERKKGRWIREPFGDEYKYDLYRCSECMKPMGIGGKNAKWFDYCPNCGARMEMPNES